MSLEVLSCNIRSFLGFLFPFFVYWNIRFLFGLEGGGGFVSWNIRKAFLWENLRIFFILELESFIFRKIRNLFRVSVSQNIWNILVFGQESSISRNMKNFFQEEFFLFYLSLGLKSALCCCILYYCSSLSVHLTFSSDIIPHEIFSLGGTLGWNWA